MSPGQGGGRGDRSDGAGRGGRRGARGGAGGTGRAGAGGGKGRSGGAGGGAGTGRGGGLPGNVGGATGRGGPARARAGGTSARAPRAERPAEAGVRGRPSTARGLGGEQIEGRQAVRELLLAARRPVRDLWVADGVEEVGILAEILELAAEQRIPVRRVARARLDAEASSEAPQGVLAHAAALPEADLSELAAHPAAFLLVVDGITDPHNLGALLRTAEVAGATGAIVPRHRAAHVSPTVAKAAAGAIEHLPIAVVPGIAAAILALGAAGVWTVGLAADGETSLFDLPVASEKVALVLGAEGAGLSRLVRQRCDVVASIPQRGRISSLNVAAAGVLACFEVFRQRRG